MPTAPSADRPARTLSAIALDPGRKFGSLEEQILALARAFQDRDSLFLPLYVAGLGSFARRPFEQRGLPVEALDLWSFRLSRLRRLVGLIDRYRIELVSWNFYDPLNPYLFALGALRPGLRHVYVHHSSRTLPLVTRRPAVISRLKHLLLHRYEAVLGVSDFVVQCLSAEGWWPSLGRFWCFVNTERFRPDAGVRAAVRERHGAGDRFVIVFVGQLIPEKGVHILLEALGQLPDDVTLWIVGEGPFEAGLRHRAAGAGLAHRVLFLGNQPSVEPYYQAADAAACPSIWGEALGLVNLEAQAAGLPMVASEIGGIPEYVRHESSGLLCPPGEAGALARQLRRLYDDRELGRRLGQAARRVAEREYTLDATLERNLAPYRPRS